MARFAPLLPQGEFRWHCDGLQERVTIIQHREDGLHAPGVRNEWRAVVVEGEAVPMHTADELRKQEVRLHLIPKQERTIDV